MNAYFTSSGTVKLFLPYSYDIPGYKPLTNRAPNCITLSLYICFFFWLTFVRDFSCLWDNSPLCCHSIPKVIKYSNRQNVDPYYPECQHPS